jgi:hypothetical protein
MLSINDFRGANEQHCFKIGVRRATLIQKTRHLDSIVARALLVADFIDRIGQKRTSRCSIALVRFVPIADESAPAADAPLDVSSPTEPHERVPIPHLDRRMAPARLSDRGESALKIL